MKSKIFNPYVSEIKELNLVNTANFSIEQIQPIIDRLIIFLYANRSGGQDITSRKHVISQSLLRNFSKSNNGSNIYIQSGNKSILTSIRDWIFCLPESKQDLWSQNIEQFFSPIENHGAIALRKFRKQLDKSNFGPLISSYVNPMETDEEIKMRLLFALYLAMHIERQAVAKEENPIEDEDFLNRMKISTTHLFFHVWTWCKVDAPTFIIPVSDPIAIIRYSAPEELVICEYILPISPTLALFVAADNWKNFITMEYVFDDKRNTDPSYEKVGHESGLLNSSEGVGQQKFMIQTGPVNYTMYHSNVRLQTVKCRDYSFSHEIFLRVTGILKQSYPIYVRAKK